MCLSHKLPVQRAGRRAGSWATRLKCRGWYQWERTLFWDRDACVVAAKAHARLSVRAALRGKFRVRPSLFCHAALSGARPCWSTKAACRDDACTSLKRPICVSWFAHRKSRSCVRNAFARRNLATSMNTCRPFAVTHQSARSWLKWECETWWRHMRS